MLVSLKWLRDYVDLPADLDIDDLATRLTMASSEVEGVHRVGDWDRALVTVGHVLAVDPHPQADRLRLATVDFGGETPQQVVCGAPNLAVGQRVAFAREGARLFDGHSGEPSVLKRSKIRGVESSGMVLSERELGLSEAHEGIIELPADAPIGAPLADYLGDVVLDVHTWPNRADTMSMLGIAREVAAILGTRWHAPGEDYSEAGPAVSEAVAVHIDDPGLCARYIATVVDGVTIGPSPAWMQERLRAAGQRPINNVVDITNYVMLELGQPLHAFDLANLRGAVGVRTARTGERLTTLDGEDRELTAATLLITDDSGPIALAGVMGGLSTEVTEATTSILLEAARFDPASIRRTSTRLHLRSEASSRFERGLSAELAEHASRRATKLLVELCGGTARAGMVDVYPRPHVTPTVVLARARLDTLLGFVVPAEEVESGLRALGFEVQVSGEGIEVRPPWWRSDVSIPDDIAEEVLRIAGYDRLPATMPSGEVPHHEVQPRIELRDRLSDAFASAGLREVITYSLTTEEVLARVMPAEVLEARPPLKLLNTLSSEQEALRPTLRHSILETVARNIRAGAQRIAIFEAGRAYVPRYEEGKGGPLPDEREQLTGAVTGFEVDRWDTPTGRRLDFFDAKGILDAALAEVGVSLDYAPADEEFGLLPGRTAALSAGGDPVGILGEVHPHTLEAFDVDQPVILFELDLARLERHVPGRFKAVSPPRFPAVEQDLAVVVDDAVPAGRLQATLESSRLVASARVFDVYRGEQLSAGKKSVAFTIRYQAADRTLTTDDANREQARLLARLEREFGAAARG
ncbi:MAG: phenylalanine--tRNA ligase subunit beta [Dehalococcoidia bacterium]|nr:phenylalanine--tRNA ligase subunit beta [Dehalococcoidia bacterium]